MHIACYLGILIRQDRLVSVHYFDRSPVDVGEIYSLANSRGFLKDSGFLLGKAAALRLPAWLELVG